jgi:tetratricopeptide (TPR) repeat protein
MSYEKALAVSSKKDYFLNLIGLMYYYDNKMPDAIINYKKAIDVNNKQAVYWSNLSLAYQVANNLEEAESAMTKAVALDNSDLYQSRLTEIKGLRKEKV